MIDFQWIVLSGFRAIFGLGPITTLTPAFGPSDRTAARSLAPARGALRRAGGGDGFYCVFDPENPDIVYAESQEGRIHRHDMRSGQIKDLRPSPAGGQTAFRFHWNSPLIGSRHKKGTMYLAGNRVFEVTNRGEEWRLISPDLSAQDPKKTVTTGSGAENYRVVYTLAESPLRAGLLRAGTDDGKLWITEDGGETWTELTAGLPAAAKGQWISRIEPSSHDAKVAYLGGQRLPEPEPRAPRVPHRRRGAYLAGDRVQPACRRSRQAGTRGPHEPESAVCRDRARAVRERGPRRALDAGRGPAHGGRGRHPGAPAGP